VRKLSIVRKRAHRAAGGRKLAPLGASDWRRDWLAARSGRLPSRWGALSRAHSIDRSASGIDRDASSIHRSASDADHSTSRIDRSATLIICPCGGASDARRQPLRSRKGVLRARSASTPPALRCSPHEAPSAGQVVRSSPGASGSKLRALGSISSALASSPRATRSSHLASPSGPLALSSVPLGVQWLSLAPRSLPRAL
jgi:hypothetical protein